MAVRAFTDDAEGLLARIYELVDQGHIRTWKYNREESFTDTPSDGSGPKRHGSDQRRNQTSFDSSS